MSESERERERERVSSMPMHRACKQLANIREAFAKVRGRSTTIQNQINQPIKRLLIYISLNNKQ